MEKLKLFINEGLHAIGLMNGTDVLNQIFFLKYKYMSGMIACISMALGMFITYILDFTEIWIYDPAPIFFLCLLTTFSEWLTGVLKAVCHNKEKFDLIKGGSILPKIISQAWALSITYHFGQSESLFAWLPTSVSIFLFTFNFVKTLYHLSLLGWFPKEVTEAIQRKLKINENL